MPPMRTKPSSFTLAAVFYLLICQSFAAGEQCFPSCRFSFCDGKSAFKMPAAHVAFTGAICDTDDITPVMQPYLNSSCEPRVSGCLPISQYSPAGVPMEPFPEDFFRTVQLRQNGVLINATGIARGEWRANQLQFLNGSCITLPLEAWYMPYSDNVFTRHNNLKDCISFVPITL